MSNMDNYVVQSLELHLFFARIMKEHALFLKAGLTPVDSACGKEAEFYKQEFEKLLFNVACLSDGVVGKKVLCSDEIVTEFTACAEQQTQRFTGICINSEITTIEKRLRCGDAKCTNAELCVKVKQINQTAIRLLDGLITLKEHILNNVLSCRMFTMNYPLLLGHIIREAKLYRTYVCGLESGAGLECQSMKQIEQFWNQIMMEHALFIRGLLDPSENKLIDTSSSFAGDYARLLEACKQKQDDVIADCTTASLEETRKFRDFKVAGTKGIQDCSIRSIILPLLADHVLREANHYIRLLSE